MGADEAGELAVGEPPERIGRGRGWGRCRGGEHEVVEAALPLPRVARPAVAAEHAHLGVRVAAAAAAAAVAAGTRRRGTLTGPDLLSTWALTRDSEYDGLHPEVG